LAEDEGKKAPKAEKIRRPPPQTLAVASAAFVPRIRSSPPPRSAAPLRSRPSSRGSAPPAPQGPSSRSDRPRRSPRSPPPPAPAAPPRAARCAGPGACARAGSFAAVLEAATRSRALTGFGWACSSSGGTPPLASRPYATAAYVAAATASLTSPPQRTLLATV